MIAQTTRCSFCQGDLAGFWSGSPFNRCRNCGLIVRNPLPTQDELNALYAVAWDDPIVHAAETGNMDRTLARQYTQGLLATIGRTSAKGLRICDFGAGTGALVVALNEAGADAYAVE